MPTCARSASSPSSPGGGCATSSPATARRPAVLAELEEALDPDILTIGFARRFATYKRAGLLFSDIDRLARILWDADRPVQIVFAGKAHPADRPGQRVIQEIFQLSRSPALRGRVFIMENYDMRVGRFLVQGVDAWLNNPRRPLEASGTSGMKAAQNGVPNISVLDGWWDEGYAGDNGWAIGGRESDPDEAAQDWADALDLYRLLEEDVVPRYYERGANGLPLRWLDVMRRAMATAAVAVLDHADAPRIHRSGCTSRPAGVAVADPTPPPRPSPKPAEPGSAVTRRISLALAIHNHQPVGNFGWVFAEVYDQAYLPMVEALERHPGVRLSLHYSGPLLEWFRAERPDFIERLRALVDRGQVEILGGGYYEPVLASLPKRDRIGQLTRMGDELESLFGRRPSGAWLAERVWEPDLPASLVDGGYDWTILDDAHFRAAAIPEEDLWGPYTTEDQGEILTVFGTEQGLRYRIPFRDVEDVIGYLRDHATEDGVAGRDDGRRRREVRRLAHHLRALLGRGPLGRPVLQALEDERRLADHGDAVRVAGARAADRAGLHPDRLVRRDGPVGAARGREPPFTEVLHRAQAERRPEARWLRGAFWRNFQVKYREINDLHKQMLRTSAAVAAMEDGADTRDGARPPLPGPVQRLLLARPVRWHLHQPHAPRDVRAPHRRRGPRAVSAATRRGRGARRPRHGRPGRPAARGIGARS